MMVILAIASILYCLLNYILYIIGYYGYYWILLDIIGFIIEYNIVAVSNPPESQEQAKTVFSNSIQ